MVQTMKSKRLRKSIKPFSPMESRKVFTMKKKSDKIYTKQEQLYRNVTYQIRNMMFYMSYLNAYEQSKQKDKVVPTEELKNARLKVYNSKKKVRKLIEELNGLQNGHVMIEELKSPKEQDCIQLNRIYCSVCLKKRNKGKTNAILICHHLGCYRAYHQHCLEPKLKNEHLPKESDDWFCPTCHCKSLILNLVNQTLEREYHTVEEIFKDDVQLEGGGEDLELDDSENDDDYDPSSSSDDSQHDHTPSMEELEYHEKFKLDDIICADKRSLRSGTPTSELNAVVNEKYTALGEKDIGRRVARMVPNEGICFGVVALYELDASSNVVKEDDSWFIKFDDGDEEELGKNEVENAFQLAEQEAEFDKILKMLQTEEDPNALMLDSKRIRTKIDYKLLSDCVFGSKSESSGDEDFDDA